MNPIGIVQSPQNVIYTNIHLTLKELYIGTVRKITYDTTMNRQQTTELTIPCYSLPKQILYFSIDYGYLAVILELEPHALFTLNGFDVQMSIDLSLDDALYGFEHFIEYLNGNSLVINRQCLKTSNEEIIFPNYGFYNYATGQYGNLIVKFNITLVSNATTNKDMRDCNFFVFDSNDDYSLCDQYVYDSTSGGSNYSLEDIAIGVPEDDVPNSIILESPIIGHRLTYQSLETSYSSDVMSSTSSESSLGKPLLYKSRKIYHSILSSSDSETYDPISNYKSFNQKVYKNMANQENNLYSIGIHPTYIQDISPICRTKQPDRNRDDVLQVDYSLQMENDQNEWNLLEEIFNLDRQIDLNVIKYYRSEKFMQPILEHQFTPPNSVVCKWQEDTVNFPPSLDDLSLEISYLPPLDNPLFPITMSTAYTDTIFSNRSLTRQIENNIHVSMISSINNKMTESQSIEEKMIDKYDFDENISDDNSESFVIINSTTHETVNAKSTTDDTSWCRVM